MRFRRRDLLLVGFATGGLLAATVSGMMILGPAPAAARTRSSRSLARLREVLSDHELWCTDPTRGTRAVLDGKELRGIELRNASLADANLDGADLSGSKFVRVDFTRTTLVGAKLERAKLQECNLTGANFTAANMTGCQINQFVAGTEDPAAVIPADHVSFRNAELVDARIAVALDRADFGNANMRNADLSGSILSAYFAWGITFAGADLSGANFSSTEIMLSDFRSASMNRATLSDANIVSCTFEGADLSFADIGRGGFFDCDLRQVKWSCADLRNSNLESNRFHEGAKQGGPRVFPPDVKIDGIRWG